MPGPAPKPAGERRRRNAPVANTSRLPAEGRKGATPAWPLDADQPAVWVELWRTPQSVAWERLGWTRTVARYALLLAFVEIPGCPPPVMAEARQMEDRLGLTPMSMLRLRWEIAEDELAGQRSAPAPARTARLKVVAEELRSS